MNYCSMGTNSSLDHPVDNKCDKLFAEGTSHSHTYHIHEHPSNRRSDGLCMCSWCTCYNCGSLLHNSMCRNCDGNNVDDIADAPAAPDW